MTSPNSRLRSTSFLGTLFIFILITLTYPIACQESKHRTCSQINFCGRYRSLKVKQRQGSFMQDARDRDTVIVKPWEQIQPAYQYGIDPESVQVSDIMISGELNLRCTSKGVTQQQYSRYLASTLQFQLNLYRIGALRLRIIEKGTKPFSLTDHGIGVEEDSLEYYEAPLQELVKRNETHFLIGGVNAIVGETGEVMNYVVQNYPFRIYHYINDELATIVNHRDTLYFENSKQFRRQDFQSSEYMTGDVEVQADSLRKIMNLEQECLTELITNLPDNKIEELFSKEHYKVRPSAANGFVKNSLDFRESHSVGFFLPSRNLFGLPERPDKFKLKTTLKIGEDPYRLTALDIFPHENYSKKPLYSSLPYLTSHSNKGDQSILWMNAAETWVDIYDDELIRGIPLTNIGSYVDFVSESGQLEFFLFGSRLPKVSAKRVQNILSGIIGFPTLPPIFALGYHYSKWEKDLSASKLIEWNYEFTRFKFPVDSFWLDIPYAQANYQYFKFDESKFPAHVFNIAKNKIKDENRQLVVITDPHLSIDSNNHAYLGAAKKHRPNQQILVKDSQLKQYKGQCWPGISSYIDFMNPQGSEYWGDLYGYGTFQGTDENFHAWLDMNEPSVFDGPEGTLPKDSVFTMEDGSYALSKDVKNLYGLKMAEATYRGLLKRDNLNKRPFILTRSSFFGTQKFAAKWTGDNTASLEDLRLSISQLLSLSISGIPFVGVDVPGFYGNPDKELYSLFYQLGALFPFFRAHGHIQSSNREPYKQPLDIQQQVRQSINLRYDLIQYLYSQFYLSTQSGAPLMRPLWHEFPNDIECIDIETEFMLGGSLLIAPKLESHMLNGSKAFLNEQQQTFYTVPMYLPLETNWYFWYNKEEVISPQLQEKINFTLQEDQQGIFVKAGTIIPIKTHEGKLSILSALSDPLKLEIFLDKHESARGTLYLDDGQTLDHIKRGLWTHLDFLFENLTLSVAVKEGDESVFSKLPSFLENLNIDGIQVFGANNLNISGYSLLQGEVLMVTKTGNRVQDIKINMGDLVYRGSKPGYQPILQFFR